MHSEGIIASGGTTFPTMADHQSHHIFPLLVPVFPFTAITQNWTTDRSVLVAAHPYLRWAK